MKLNGSDDDGEAPHLDGRAGTTETGRSWWRGRAGHLVAQLIGFAIATPSFLVFYLVGLYIDRHGSDLVSLVFGLTSGCLVAVGMALMSIGTRFLPIIDQIRGSQHSKR